VRDAGLGDGLRVENFMESRVIIYICERLAPAIISIMHIK
jgi:hypothetical protein